MYFLSKHKKTGALRILFLMVFCFALFIKCATEPGYVVPEPTIHKSEIITLTLLLKSDPTGAKIIYANGEYRGRTPLRIENQFLKQYWTDGDITCKFLGPVKEGYTPKEGARIKWPINLKTDGIASKEGYETSAFKVDWGYFSGGSEIRERTISLEKLPEEEGVPPVAGQQQQQEMQQQMMGPTIVITNTGQPVSGSQAVEIKEFGLVVFKSIPEACEVFVQGNSIGVTPTGQIKFQTGTYSIEVRKKGWKQWNRSIMVAANSTITILAELEEE